VGLSARRLQLAVGMVSRGRRVERYCHDGGGFHDSYVEGHAVTVRVEPPNGKPRKIRDIRSWLRSFRPNVVHAFMKRASSLAVLTRVSRGGGGKVIASDMLTAAHVRHSPDLWAMAFWRLDF